MQHLKFFILLLVLFSLELTYAGCLPESKNNIPRENSVTMNDIYLMDITKCDISELELANSNLEYYSWQLRNLISGNRDTENKKISKKEKSALMPNLTAANATLSLVKLEIQKRTGSIPKNFSELYK